MYSIGGWKVMPGSCSTGFRSAPSPGIGNSRPNGSDVKMMKARKPTAISPITAITREANTSGSFWLNAASATVHILRIRIHSSSEPSCAPHTAAMR